MSTSRRDRDDRIRGLKNQIKRATGSEPISWESEGLSRDQREELWERVLGWESAPSTTNFQQLIDAGIALPDPNAMDDRELAPKLWEAIIGLARLSIFLSETDHLSDRELYTILWRDVLRHDIPLVPDVPGSASHVDLLGGCGETDIALYFRYYADERERNEWLMDFPDYDMPAHEDPPYDRDRHLPVPEWVEPVLSS